MRKSKLSIIFFVILAVTALAITWINKENAVTKSDFMFDTYCTVTVYGNEAEAAADAVFERIGQIHSAANAFSEASELSRINSAKAGEAVAVNDDVVNIIKAAIKVSAASNGAFDICIAPVVSLWNFKGEGDVPEHNEIEAALALTGADKIFFDEKTKTVTKSDDSVKIDMGGAAKGYAGDAAVEVLKKFDISGAIVDLGGNISCTGTNPNSEDGLWRIGLQTPFAPTGEYDKDRVVEIAGGSVVTSGTYQRYFEKDGKIYHHIIDPETGYPADREYSGVTVVTESSLLGDCLSTACFVAGPEKGEKLAKNFGAECFFLKGEP